MTDDGLDWFSPEAMEARARRDRYFLREGDGPERPVSMEEFVRGERACGFHNTLGCPHLPATAGFSSSKYDGRVPAHRYGRVEHAPLERATDG